VFANELGEVEAGAIGHEIGGSGLQDLDGEGAQVIFQTRAPGELDGVAGLEGGGEPGGTATTDEAGIAAATGNHGFSDDAGFAVTANADQQGFTGPFQLFHCSQVSFGARCTRRHCRA